MDAPNPLLAIVLLLCRPLYTRFCKSPAYLIRDAKGFDDDDEDAGTMKGYKIGKARK